VDNAVHAVVRALDHPREADGHAFNVGDAHVPDAADLCRALAASLGLPLEVGPPAPGEAVPDCPWAVPRPVVLETAALRARLGYAEPVAWAEALARTARWLWELPPAEVPVRLGPFFARWGGAA
jgi:nucleoside-diphosphate-sugar epimerase